MDQVTRQIATRRGARLDGLLPYVRSTGVAIAAGALILALPALINGFPFLFWDTGGYIAAAATRTVTAGRSTFYGLILMLGRWPDFWPVVLAQCVLSAWMIALVLRTHGMVPTWRRLVAICALLAALTALPVVAGQLMPDILAGLAGLALYLLLCRDPALSRRERMGLGALVAVAGACHASILAISLVLLAGAMLGSALWPPARRLMRLGPAALAVALALLLTPAVNLAVAGRFETTPGGTAFVFGRLLEDGLVARHLDRHCPDPAFPLCDWRGELPETANDFLWGDTDMLRALGGIEGSAPVLRQVILGSLAEEPVLNLALAIRAFAAQLVTTGTGEGLLNRLYHSYSQIERHAPHAYAAMIAARQQSPEGLDFTGVNALHVPVAIGAFLLLLPAAMLARRAGRTDLCLLAGAAAAVLLANAAICGILSCPTDRYQSRVAWLAVLVLAMMALTAGTAFRRRWRERP